MAPFWTVLDILALVVSHCLAISQYRLGVHKSKGKIGESFRFFLRIHDKFLKDEEDDTFQIQMFLKNNSKVVQTCVATMEEEEPYPAKLPDGFVTLLDAPTSFGRVRLFEFTLLIKGEFGVSAKPTIEADKPISKIEDIQSVFITVTSEFDELNENDCMLSEIFTINDEETFQDMSKTPVSIDIDEPARVKMYNTNPTCDGKEGLKHRWHLHRILQDSMDKGRRTSQCMNYRKVGPVDLPKLLRHSIRTPIDFRMDLSEFVIQPRVLPPGYYRICAVLEREAATRQICGFFRTPVIDTSDALRPVVSPPEETFISPFQDVTIDASRSAFIHELPESGYSINPTLRFIWRCYGDIDLCSKIKKFQTSVSADVDSTMTDVILTSGSVVVIKESWITTNIIFVSIQGEISAYEASSRSTYTKSFYRNITFVDAVGITKVPFLKIRCMVNCWHYVNMDSPMLLGLGCDNCEEFPVEEVTLRWEPSSPDVVLTGNGTIYAMLSNLSNANSTELLMTLKFDFVGPTGVHISSSSTRTFIIPEAVRTDELTEPSFVRKDTVGMEDPFPSYDMLGMDPFGESNIYFPFIYTLSVSGEDFDIARTDTEENCGKGWKYHKRDDNCLMFMPDRFPWSSARVQCKDKHLDADLVVIHSSAMNRVVAGMIPAGEKAWLGLKVKGNTSHSWLFRPKEKNYENWAQARSTESGCGFIMGKNNNGTWGRENCSFPLASLCQYSLLIRKRKFVLMKTASSPTDVNFEVSSRDVNVEVQLETSVGHIYNTQYTNISGIEENLPIKTLKDFQKAVTQGITYLGALTMMIISNFEGPTPEHNANVNAILTMIENTEGVLSYSTINIVLVTLDRLLRIDKPTLDDLVHASKILSQIAAVHRDAQSDPVNDEHLFRYQLHIIDLISAAYVAMRTKGLVNSNDPTGQLISEGNMRLVSDILQYKVEKMVQQFPHIDCEHLEGSTSCGTWIDVNTKIDLKLDLKTVMFTSSMANIKEAFNLFSFDPYINIGAYASPYLCLKESLGYMKMHLPVLVVHAGQKQPLQFALEDSPPDSYKMKFFFKSTSLSTADTNHNLNVYSDLEDSSDENTIEDSDCLLIKVTMSKDYSSLLTFTLSEDVRLEVTVVMARRKKDTLDMFSQLPKIIPPEIITNKTDISKTVFYPKLTLKQDYQNKGGYYFTLIRIRNGQRLKESEKSSPGGRIGEARLRISCLRLTCARYSFYDHAWSSQFCRPFSKVGEEPPAIECVCDGGEIFSGGSMACQEINAVDWDDYSIKAINLSEIETLSLTVFVVMIALWMVLIATLLWTNKRDHLERKYAKTLILEGLFTPYAAEHFLVCIITGVMKNCGTTSIPCMTLVGNVGTTPRISLAPLHGMFQTGSEVWFMLSCNTVLGNLERVVLSLDTQGESKSWYVTHLFLRNVTTSKDWHCACDEWIPNPANNNRYIVKIFTESSGHKTRLRALRFVHLVRQLHLIVGTFFNLQGSSYNKTQHALNAFCSILLIMCVCMWSVGVLEAELKGDRNLAKTQVGNVVGKILISVGATSVPTLLIAYVIERASYQVMDYTTVSWPQKCNFEPELDESPSISAIAPRPSSLGLTLQSYDTSDGSRSSLVLGKIVDEVGASIRITRLMSPSLGSHMSLRTRPFQRPNSVKEATPFFLYEHLLDNMKLKNDKTRLRSFISKRLDRDRPMTSRHLLIYLNQAMAIVVMSYILLVYGFYVKSAVLYFLVVVATFFIVLFIVHPLVTAFTVLTNTTQLNLCAAEADQRMQGSRHLMHICIKMIALNKSETDRNCLAEFKSCLPFSFVKRYFNDMCQTMDQKQSSISVHDEESESHVMRYLNFIFIGVILLLINVQSGSVSQRYLQTKFLRNLLIVGRSEMDLSQNLIIEDFWLHLRSKIHLTTYWWLDNLNTTASLKAISNVKLHQVRVNKFDGNCAESFPNAIEPSCHFDIDESSVDTKNYAFTWEKPTTRVTVDGPYTHATGSTFSTIKHSYPAGGYQALFSVRNKRPDMIDYLQRQKWVDEKTRAVRVDLALFNADTQLVTSITHVYEFTSVGIYQDTPQTFTFPLFFDSDSLILMRGLIMSLVIFTLYYTIVELTTVYRQGILHYFSSASAWLDLFERTGCVMAIFYFGEEYRIRGHAVENVQNIYFENRDAKTFIDFTQVSEIAFKISLTSCLVALVTFIKVILKTNNVPSMSQFLELIPPAAGITYLPFMCIICYAGLGYHIFKEFKEFATFKSSVFTVTSLMLNQGLLKSLVEAYWLMAPVFITLTYSVLSYIILNYYITILCEHYARIRELQRCTNEEGAETLADTIRKFLNPPKLKSEDEGADEDDDDDDDDEDMEKYPILDDGAFKIKELIAWLSSREESRPGTRMAK